MLVFNRGNENVEVHSGSQRSIESPDAGFQQRERKCRGSQRFTEVHRSVPMLVFNRVNENVEVHSGLQR